MNKARRTITLSCYVLVGLKGIASTLVSGAIAGFVLIVLISLSSSGGVILMLPGGIVYGIIFGFFFLAAGSHSISSCCSY